jgi:hypothetical protein
MPAKSETRKPRTKIKNIHSKAKDLGQSDQKRVKGGARYIEQDNLYKSRADAAGSMADASLVDAESLARSQDG